MSFFSDLVNPFSSGFFKTSLDPFDLAGRQKRQEKEKIAEIQSKRDRLESGRQAAETLRRAQAERASLLQTASNRGVSSSSAVQGGLGSIQSQAGANLGFANQIFALNQQAGGRLAKLGKLNDLTKIGMTIGSFFTGGIAGAAVAAGSAGAGSGGSTTGGLTSSGSFTSVGPI